MERKQFRILYRAFLFRMVDLELLSPQADISKLLGQFAALLVFVSLILAGFGMGVGGANLGPRDAWFARWASEHFLIATTMLVVGVFAILSWNSTFLDTRDVMVLSPLPIRSRTLFFAKIAAVATSLSLTIVALHLISTLLWPIALGKETAGTNMPALTSDPALPPVTVDQIPEVLRRDLEQAHPNFGGVSVGVLQHGQRRVMGYGTGKPDSIYELGSISKTFTALILARMVAQGRVRLEEPVRELLPEDTVKKPRGREITLLDLATHRSGLPLAPDNVPPNTIYAVPQMYEYLARRGLWKPSKIYFEYSNLGFALLGQALASRAGVPYADLLREQVTDPLGLRDTTLSLRPEQNARLIQGYDSKHQPVRHVDFGALDPAGGILSTADDLLTYLDANLHPEKVAFGNAILECRQMRADVNGDTRIGLAWLHDGSSGIFSHGGTTNGYDTYAFFDPAQDLAVVVLHNQRTVTLAFAEMLASHIRQRLLGRPAISMSEITIPASGGKLRTIRMFAVYWATMFSAGAFIFCCVLGAQGLSAQLLPRRAFLRISSFLQVAAFCLFLCVYFLQPMLAYPAALIAAQRPGLLGWSPSYWFLGLMQDLSGVPAFGLLAHRAYIGIAVAFLATALAYTLSYLRTIRKAVEEPDIVPGFGRFNWLPRFGGSLETAVAQFSIRTLLRSRQHRVILAFYLGLGLALVILFLKTPLARLQWNGATVIDPWHEPNVAMLASSILMMGAWVAGIRVVLALPLDRSANWLFRITPLPGGERLLAARRRAFLVMAVLPVLLIAALWFGSLWPWRAAATHVLVLVLLAVTIAEFSLKGAQKIPFTCSYLPGKSNFHIMFWLGIGVIMILVDGGAQLELRALGDPGFGALVLAVLIMVAGLARWRAQASVRSDESVLRFEEVQSPVISELGLHRDGTVVMKI